MKPKPQLTAHEADILLRILTDGPDIVGQFFEAMEGDIKAVAVKLEALATEDEEN